MLKITRLADYSVLILCCFRGEKLTAKDISNKIGLGLATVNKILSLLVKANILRPIRGSNGGYLPDKKRKRNFYKRYYRGCRRSCSYHKVFRGERQKL